MSKTYALTLMLTGVTVFSSLLYLQNQYLATKYQETFAYAEAVQQQTIELTREQLDELVRKTNYLLRDETKYRFRPIGPFLDNARAEEEVLISAAEALAQENAEELTELLRLRTNLLVNLSDSALGLLETYGHLIDLSPRDIEFKTTNISKIINRVNTPFADDFDEFSFSLQRDLILLDYLNVLGEVFLDITQIMGGKTISCGGYFPVISADVVNPRKGETVRAKVSIGSYSSALNPKNVLLIAGQDTLTINPDGTADYEFSSRKRGAHRVKLFFQITNPLTGEVKTGRSDYTYNVH
jgi:hypothetical protein